MTALTERHRRSLSIIGALLLLSMLAASSDAVGQASTEVEITIVPSSPTPSDAVQVTVSGTWHNACVPQDPEVSFEGSEITIVTSVERALCAEVLTDFSFAVDLGTLDAGSYGLTVTYRQAERDPETIAHGGFDVQASSPDACDYDANANGVIDDAELLDAIDDWIEGTISDAVLLQLIDWWVAATSACAKSP